MCHACLVMPPAKQPIHAPQPSQTPHNYYALCSSCLVHFASACLPHLLNSPCLPHLLNSACCKQLLNSPCLPHLLNPPYLPRFLPSSQEVVALIAYQDPSLSPLKHLLCPSQREMVADVINAAVLNAANFGGKASSNNQQLQQQQQQRQAQLPVVRAGATALCTPAGCVAPQCS